jgi:hypothetical protein
MPRKEIGMGDQEIKRRLREEHNFLTLDEQQQLFLQTLAEYGGTLPAAIVQEETGFGTFTFSRVRKTLVDAEMIGTFACLSGLTEQGAAFVDPKQERYQP